MLLLGCMYVCRVGTTGMRDPWYCTSIILNNGKSSRVAPKNTVTVLLLYCTVSLYTDCSDWYYYSITYYD
jgi:hypothetical protein